MGFVFQGDMYRLFQPHMKDFIFFESLMTMNRFDDLVLTRWFKVAFSSPIWRSLNHLKGYLTIPKRSQRTARMGFLNHHLPSTIPPRKAGHLSPKWSPAEVPSPIFCSKNKNDTQNYTQTKPPWRPGWVQIVSLSFLIRKETRGGVPA